MLEQSLALLARCLWLVDASHGRRLRETHPWRYGFRATGKRLCQPYSIRGSSRVVRGLPILEAIHGRSHTNPTAASTGHYKILLPESRSTIIVLFLFSSTRSPSCQ
ncbi:hypothetical protein B0H17DRAFT_667848 [Mycena rosella]|uniref:Secreted protein n=1 Tax=Mycena rosella TaxID=1033263 RepID=A0AAD7M8C4_MYCRO|nr:hypothetical protein B0H17DRAFT_667848 [Mycena rosella]